MAYSALKRLLIGRPLSTREFEHQRLPKRLALGVFSTDAIASTAFSVPVHVLESGRARTAFPAARGADAARATSTDAPSG